MKASEIRQRFLKFFERHSHAILRSDSLVPPAEDKSLLFTGAGMNQFKNEFLGRGRPGLKRAATSQKCFRSGDLDSVGRTAYHHTFFEMLGNFSFGDYFKREAIVWAWEFMVKEMNLPPERLRVSVYEDDDEAYDIWRKDVGLAPKIICRYGQHDNFWPADASRLGPNGLCGPCSEIFYDWGPTVGCGKSDCEPSCHCNRFCEVWNLVFQQFERKDGGGLEPLPHKNIDTGMGLERLVAVMQGKLSNFDTDLFAPIIKAVEQETSREYEPVRNRREGVAFRRIADHARAGVFCICDGILPSNTGRGYVLRKLLRRAVLDSGRLGKKEPFLYRLAPIVVKTLSDQYPELAERRENIARLIRIEEERFLQTLEQGRSILDGFVRQLRESAVDTLPGAEAFRLFDTYGLPYDVTESILEDESIRVDRDGFEREMERQRELSRKSTKISANIFGGGPIGELKEVGCTTQFQGYEQDEIEGRVLGIIADEELREEIGPGHEATIILNKTTFYAEAGGEVGDTGFLESAKGRFDVTDTRRAEGMFLHVGKVISGVVHISDNMAARPDIERRAAIRRNHTATHLLHLALREVLGKHAEQAGSMVAPDRLRFDFHHPQAMTAEEIRLVEDKANERILRCDPVAWRIVPLAQARAEGAMALFGEKYGDEVRLLDIGGYSRELCGGLHCATTGQIGMFKIVGESSVAAGIRRIEGITGLAAIQFVREKEETLRAVGATLGAPEARLVERALEVTAQIKELRRDLQKTRQSGGGGTDELLKNARDVAGVKIISAKLDETAADDMRGVVDQLRQTCSSCAVALGSSSKGRATIIVALTNDLVEKGLHAGEIAGEAAKLMGGGGGGKPDLAQAGGKDAASLDKAVAEAVKLISEKLGKA